MIEVTIQRDSDGSWVVLEDGKYVERIEGTLKARDAISDLRKIYPGAKFGIRASDIGPAVAYQCLIQGYGNTLWMRN